MSWGLLQVTTMFFVSDTDWQCWTMVIMVWYGKRLLWPLFLWLIYIYSCCYHYHDNGKFIGKHTVNYYDWLCVCFYIKWECIWKKWGHISNGITHIYNIYIYGMVRYPLVHGLQRVHQPLSNLSRKWTTAACISSLNFFLHTTYTSKDS